MNDYLEEGCISKMPIYENDRIGALIVIKDIDKESGLLQDKIPVIAAPIIWGEYDGYGGINPDESYNCKIISEIFNDEHIEDILYALVCSTHYWDNAEDIDDIDNCEKILQLSNKFNEIYLVMEHEHVLRTIIEYTGNNGNEENKNVEYFNKMFDKQHDDYIRHLNILPYIKVLNKFKKDNPNHTEDDIKKFRNDYISSHNINLYGCNYIYKRKYIVFPTLTDEIYTNSIYNTKQTLFVSPPMLLYTSADRHFELTKPEIKQNYCETLALWHTLLANNIFININHTTGQKYTEPDGIWQKLTKAYVEINTQQNKR